MAATTTAAVVVAVACDNGTFRWLGIAERTGNMEACCGVARLALDGWLDEPNRGQERIQAHTHIQERRSLPACLVNQLLTQGKLERDRELRLFLCQPEKGGSLLDDVRWRKDGSTRTNELV